MQTLKLVDRRFGDLLQGRKTNTIRSTDNEVSPGWLLFVGNNDPSLQALVWVTAARRMKLRDVPGHNGLDDLLQRMTRHYPGITLDTEVLCVEHLSPAATLAEKGHPADFDARALSPLPEGAL